MRDSNVTLRLLLALAMAGVVGCNVATSSTDGGTDDEQETSDGGPKKTDNAKSDGGKQTTVRDAGQPQDEVEDAGTDVAMVGAPCDLVAQDCVAGAGSCMMVTETDGGIASRCVTGACDLVAQNCPTDTKCAYVGDPGTGVVSRMCGPEGTLAEGAPCGAQGTDDCAKGLICITPQGATVSTCAKFCYSNANCGTDMQCSGVLQVPGLVELPMVCQPTPASCDPFAQDCPNVGEGCFLTGAGPTCAPAGTVANGQACTAANACQVGSACAGGFCRQVCNTAAPTCATGTCQAVQAPGVTGAGICL